MLYCCINWLKYFDKYWPVLQNILKYHLSYNTAMIFMLDISFLFMTLPEFWKDWYWPLTVRVGHHRINCSSWSSSHWLLYRFQTINRGRHGRVRMVVGFTTTYAISTYHHWRCEFESRSGRGVRHYVIKFVSDLRQVGGFFRTKGDILL